jgi:hypothetical protein
MIISSHAEDTLNDFVWILFINNDPNGFLQITNFYRWVALRKIGDKQAHI